MATRKGLSAGIADDEQAPPWPAEESPVPLRSRGALPGSESGRPGAPERGGIRAGLQRGGGTNPACAPPAASRGSSRPARRGPRPALYLALPGEEGPGSSGRAPGATRGGRGRGGAGVSMAIASRPGGAVRRGPAPPCP